jgi:ligand-binding SRPBCC domain-containing protein
MFFVMRFCFEHVVTLPREQVFAFFENPERLGLLHAAWSKIRLLHHECQVRVGAETWVEVTVGRFLPLVLGFRHFAFERPVSFGEEAIHGPFSRFIHVHEFVDQGRQTMVRDVLEVRLPWHYGGEIVMKRGVAPAIRRMFRKRAEALGRLVSDGTVERCTSRPIATPAR